MDRIDILGAPYAGSDYYQLDLADGYKSLILKVLASQISIPSTPSIDEIAGNKFFTNALSLAARYNGLDGVYNRMEQNAAKQKGNVWAGLYGGGKTADEFSVNRNSNNLSLVVLRFLRL
ncbi:MAG: hypothetical protein LBV16_04195 [Elusimicrobiota bacterium]|nr:hypothetical protein [Elusimicrobiota bacterium]